MPWLLLANDEAMDFFNTLTLGNLFLDPSAILDPSNPRRPWNPRPLGDPLLPLFLSGTRVVEGHRCSVVVVDIYPLPIAYYD